MREDPPLAGTSQHEVPDLMLSHGMNVIMPRMLCGDAQIFGCLDRLDERSALPCGHVQVHTGLFFK